MRSPSVADLEREGVVQVLNAEAQGQLRVRHPYLYASAADLRVCDVEVLLAAYKQLVRDPADQDVILYAHLLVGSCSVEVPA